MKFSANKICFYFSFFLLSVLPASYFLAQQSFVPISFTLRTELEAEKLNNNIHFSAFPLLRSSVKKGEFGLCDSLYKGNRIGRKIRGQSLLQVNEGEVALYVDPLFNFSYGQTRYGDSVNRLFYNYRGVRIIADLGSKFSFETQVWENQLFVPNYMDSLIDQRGGVPGMGRSKSFKNNGHDVGYASGYFSWKPYGFLSVQFGQGKHFFGSGMRSLLWSDNAPNYPFFQLRILSSNSKWEYQSINSWLISQDRQPVHSTPEALFKSKWSTIRYLSFKPIDQLEIGLFEGVIYKKYDETLGEISPNPIFYTPIIGLGTTAALKHNELKVINGINLRLRLIHQLILYGQLASDGLKKLGIQGGIKYLEPFGLKNSWIMTEFNKVDKQMYGMPSDNILQNFTHQNYELAHPEGAGFLELILRGRIEFKGIFVDTRWQYTERKRTLPDDVNNNILLPLIDGNSAKSVGYITQLTGADIGYLINRNTRMQVYCGIYNFTQQFDQEKSNELFIKFGWRTTLSNSTVSLQ